MPKLKWIISDPNMIKFEEKARSPTNITHVNSIKSLISRRRSLHDYVASFKAQQSSDNWRRLKNDLRTSFAPMGLIAPFHFMMDIGLPLMKPDIVVARIFYRLGLIPCEEFKKDSDAETVVPGKGSNSQTRLDIPSGTSILFSFCEQWAGGEETDIGLMQGIKLGETSSSRAVAYAKSRASATISMW